jgi:hypothetical protein
MILETRTICSKLPGDEIERLERTLGAYHAVDARWLVG